MPFKLALKKKTPKTIQRILDGLTSVLGISGTSSTAKLQLNEKFMLEPYCFTTFVFNKKTTCFRHVQFWEQKTVGVIN